MSDQFIIKEPQVEKPSLNFVTQEHMLFSTPFWQTQVQGVDNASIKEYCYHLMKNTDGVVISNRGGFHSKEILKPIPDALNFLVDQIHAYINGYCSQITGINDLAVGNLWVNINPTGTFNRTHDHQNAVLSAVYYVDAEGPKIGDFIIERDDHMEFFAGKYKGSPIMKVALPITPLTNFLFVIPAWTYHSVEPNLEKHDRISIAINFVQPGQSQQEYGT
tara:strand:+ start:103 stop:759 length:657 start_codon:yes stop_codon:yes gene_type:complete